jgi:hypothetical protein
VSKRAVAHEANRPLKRRTHRRFSRNGTMVIFFPVILKKLFVLGRNYPYPKPGSCPRCDSVRLWGHGFVPAYFDGYHQFLWLKRYRCPDCGCIIRLRPKGYFKRFQAAITTIRSSMMSKACRNKWISGIGRTRQRHWFRFLCRRIKVHLTDAWDQGIVAGFDYLYQMGQTPVSRAI